MRAANFTEFRTKLKQFLDDVEKNNETLIIKRGSGNGTVLISLDEYNSWQETKYLMSTPNNQKRLLDAIKDTDEGNFVTHSLIEG